MTFLAGLAAGSLIGYTAALVMAYLDGYVRERLRQRRHRP